MDYWFYNTDSGGAKGYSVLIDRSCAVTSGPISFGEQLGQLTPGDCLLMYENGVGIVAAGTVLGQWNEKTYSRPIYYTGSHEYRIPVDWYRDLTNHPITIAELKEKITYAPRGTVRRIVKRRGEIETLLTRHFAKSVTPPSHIRSPPRV